MNKKSFNDNSLKEKAAMYFSSIKNNLFTNSKEEILNIEDECDSTTAHLLENINGESSANNLKIETLEEMNQSLIIVKLSESEKSNFLNEIIEENSDKIYSFKESLSNTFDNSLIKFNDIIDKSMVFSQDAGNTLIEFSKNINAKFTEYELRQKLLNALTKVDLIFFISALEKFKTKYKNKSKEFIALTALIGLITYINNSNHNPKNILDNNEIEINDLFKNITFKSVVEITEPIILIIPNGNYILLILKLFI